MTKAQLAILKRMASGEEVWSVRSGARLSCFWHSSSRERSPRRDTIFTLEDHGLIEDREKENLRWRGSKYRITDKGRAVLGETT